MKARDATFFIIMKDLLMSLWKRALWKIFNRPERPSPWTVGGNLPWDDPAFSARMLREHLDESHGAASRQAGERAAQCEWLWRKLALQPGHHLVDVTCGPGLYMVEMAKRGSLVTAVDFSPASIAYAQNLAAAEGVDGCCAIIQQDIREFDWGTAVFDAAILLYGQLAVFTHAEAQAILAGIAQSLKPGGRLVIELLNQDRVDKKESSWWFTDDTGLWGDAPFLHLGERFWNAGEAISVERFHILHLDTGQLDEITLCDQTYAVSEMVDLLKQSGFTGVETFPDWDGLPLYDAGEWVVYLAER